VLVSPKDHIVTLSDLPTSQIGRLFEQVQIIARAVESALDAEGTFVAINNRVSQTVPHLHVHVVPRRNGDGLKGFFWPRRNYQDGQAKEAVRDSIERAIRRLMEGTE
jgi:histidine triad (HIT) family protein